MKTHLFVVLLLACGVVSAAKSPEERKALFTAATQRLKDSGIEKRIPKKGDAFPDLTVGSQTVSQWLKQGPLVLTFYRGGWCPHCVKQLKELDARMAELEGLKAQLVAVSPEKELEVRKTKSKNGLKFLLLPDQDHALARKLGLVFKLEDEVASEYKNLGINLEESQGNAKNELPVPATFVIGTDRKIRYVFADADYTKRADLDEVIRALK